MTRKFLSLALANVLGCGIAFGADSNYTTEGKEKVTRNGLTLYVEPNSPNKDKILNGEFDNIIETIKNNSKNSVDNEEVRSAPAVSKVYILQVCSSEVGYCEDIREGQTSTSLNHGGNPFFVWTQVKGYGGRNTDSASFAGNQANMLDCIGVEGSNRVITGWMEQWDISKPSNTNGTFTYTAHSINVGPTMSTSIYIK